MQNINKLMFQVILTFSDIIFQHRNRVYILYTKIEQNDVYKIINVYKIFDKRSYINCIQKELLQLHFVYKMYTKVCGNVEYSLYTFCIHQFWSTISAHHKNYAYNFYAKFKQNVYRNNCM